MKEFFGRVYTTMIHDLVFAGFCSILFIVWVQMSSAELVIQIPTIEKVFKK